jgi:hypothetical protein
LSNAAERHHRTPRCFRILHLHTKAHGKEGDVLNIIEKSKAVC